MVYEDARPSKTLWLWDEAGRTVIRNSTDFSVKARIPEPDNIQYAVSSSTLELPRNAR